MLLSLPLNGLEDRADGTDVPDGRKQEENLLREREFGELRDCDLAVAVGVDAEHTPATRLCMP